ncbi:MAG: GC-type dockerin domain-anchored protein [Phycisphaerales bacterium]
MSRAATALVLAAFVTQHALAGDSHGTAPTPGGMAQSAAFPSTCGCGFNPGDDISTQQSGADGDFDQSTFVGGISSVASSYQGTYYDLSGDCAATLGAIRGHAYRASLNSANFAGGYANGGWNDRLTVSHPSYAGQAGYVVFHVRVRASFHAAGFSGSSQISTCIWKNDAAVGLNAYFDPADADSVGSTQNLKWKLATYAGNASEDRSIDSVVTFSVPITIGTQFKLGVFASAAGGQRSKSSVGGGSYSSLDFSSGGVTWDGVGGVYVNNQLITDYTISAQSGVDWTLPFSDCNADFNQDGFVNGDDFDAFATLFEAGDLGADFNHDGFVNGDDYDAFASGFESGC